MESKARGLKKYKVLCAHQRFEEEGRVEDTDVGQRVKTKLQNEQALEI